VQWNVEYAAELEAPFPAFFPLYDKIFLVGGNTTRRLYASALSLGAYIEPTLELTIPPATNFPFGWDVLID